MQNLQKDSLNIEFEKRESIIKELHNNRQLLISIKTFDDFSLHKIKFTQFFFDIEDELRESLQNARNSFIEIKELKDQIELFKQRHHILENKYSNSENYIRELKLNVKECLEQIKFQESFQLKKENYITELEEKIKVYKQGLKMNNFKYNDQKFLSSNTDSNELAYNDLYNKNLIMKDKINNNLNNDINQKTLLIKSAKNEILENEEFKKNELLNSIVTNPSNHNIEDKGSNFAKININENYDDIHTITLKQNIKKFDNAGLKSNDIEEESFDSSMIYKIKEKLNYSQYNEIISERENSKKLINDYIKDSLIFNNNKNNIPSKNDITFNLNLKNSSNLNYAANNNFHSDEKIITFGRQEENKIHLYNYNLSNISNNKITDNDSNAIVNDFNNKDITYIHNSKNSSNIAQTNPNNKEKIKITYNTFDISIQEEKLEQIDKEFNEKSLHKDDNLILRNRALNLKNYENKIENDSNINAQSLEIINNNNNINNNSDVYDFLNEKNNKNIFNNNNSFLPNQSTRADKILEIVVKIRTIEDISSIIYHLFGEDILDKIISLKVDDDLIEKIDATIKEIERLMKNGILFIIKILPHH